MFSVKEAFTNSFGDVLFGFASFAPQLIVAILIFIIAWIFGSLLGRGVKEFFQAIKLDNLMSHAGLDDLSKKTGMHFSASGFLGALVRWFVVIVGLVAVLNVLELRDLNMILSQIVVVFLPKIAIASIVLIAAAYISKFVAGVVAVGSSSVDAGKHSMMFATFAKYAVWVFAFLIVIGQLGIGAEYFGTLFTGLVFMLALAGGLAFGLGGKEHASRVLDKISREVSNK